MSADTIAAVATPAGRGGIGIVRISGPQAARIGEAISGRALVVRRALHCTFRDASGAVLDEGIALAFAGPHSYTGEDVVELQGHGGNAVLALVLDRCRELGARLARPGEFTERAFLNGRLDLAQAEAVADLIDAGSKSAARAAARSLTGEFSRDVHALADRVLELRTLTEAALDFPDEDIDFVRAADAAGRLARIRDDLHTLIGRAQRGALLREGIDLVLVGQPNVGKSSLMNALAREDVAIVTEIAGTTRDALRAHVEIGGIPVTVVDTAGLRTSSDPIEVLGIERTRAAVAQAGVALVIVDARAGDIGVADAQMLARLPPELPRIVVHNKIDLCTGTEARKDDRGAQGIHVWLSAKTGAGIALLESAVLDVVGGQEDVSTAFLARARHLEALAATAMHLEQAAAEIGVDAPPLELFAENLREAHQALGTIVGITTADDLLGAIFSRFCIGK